MFRILDPQLPQIVVDLVFIRFEIVVEPLVGCQCFAKVDDDFRVNLFAAGVLVVVFAKISPVRVWLVSELLEYVAALDKLGFQIQFVELGRKGQGVRRFSFSPS